MCGVGRPFRVGFIDEPLSLLTEIVGDPDVLAVSAAVALGASALFWTARNLWNPKARLHLWPLPLAAGLAGLVPQLLEYSSQYYCRIPTLVATWLVLPALAAVALFMLARGRRLSLAGWMFLPTLAVGAVAYDLFMWSPVDASVFRPQQFGFSSHAVYGRSLLFASVGLFATGCSMALFSFAPSAIRLGHASRLATRGALLIAVAFLLECHRALLFAWYLNDFDQASQLWALRNHLLLGIGAIAALSLLLGWRGRRRLRETPRLRRAARALSVLQLVVLGVSLVTLEVSVRASFGVAGLLASPPQCPTAPCTPGNRIAEADEPTPRYPVHQTDMAVIDAGWAENVSELEARWAE